MFKLQDIGDDDPTSMLVNALTYIYMSYGIPMIYYGTESLYNGGADPLNREVYDPFSHKSIESKDEIAKQLVQTTIKTLNEVRRKH
jgi:glycosidase